MAISRAEKRAYLEDAYDAAVTADIELRVQLRTLETKVASDFPNGQFITRVTANGVNTEFADPSRNYSATPQEMRVLYRDLIDLHDKVKTAYLAAGNQYPNRKELFDTMIADESLENVGRARWDDYRYAFH